MPDQDLQFVLRFRDEASRTLKQAARALDQLGRSTGKVETRVERFNKALRRGGEAVQRFGQGVRRAGQGLTVRATLPIAALGAGILKTAGDFEQSLNIVQNVTGATEEQFARLRAEAADLGATTAFTAAQAADGLVFLGRAGLGVERSISALSPSLNLAAANQLSLGESANIVTNILAGFRLETEQLPDAVDVLTRTAQRSNTTVRGLGEAFSFVGPIAAARGQDFRDIGALLGSLGNAGIFAGRAGTSLTRILTKLGAPSKEAAVRLDQLGIEVLDAQGNMRPLIDILEDFSTATLKVGDDVLLFGQRGGPAFSALIGQGLPAIRALRAEIEDVAGTAREAQEVQLRGLFGALRQLRSAAEAVAIAIGESGLLRTVTSFALRITEFLRDLRGTSRELLAFGVLLAGAATAVGPLLSAVGLATIGIGALGRALGALRIGALLTGPLGLAVLALAGATAALVVFRDEVITVEGRTARLGDFVAATFEVVQDVVAGASRFIVDTFTQAVNLTLLTFDGVGDDIGGEFDQALLAAKAVGNAIIQVFQIAGAGIITSFRLAFRVLDNAVKRAVDRIIQIREITTLILDGEFRAALDVANERVTGLFDGFGEVAQEGLDRIKAAFEGDPIGAILAVVGDRAGVRFRNSLAEAIEDPATREAVNNALEPLIPTTEGTGEEAGNAFVEGFRNALAALREEVGDATKNFEEAFTSAFQQTEDALLDFIQTGELNLKAFAQSILREFNRAFVRNLTAQIIGPGGGQTGGLGGVLRGAFGFLGGLFGGGAPAGGGLAAGQTAGTLPIVRGPVFAEGGISDRPDRFAVRRADFDGAPRFQFGGRTDSIPAFLSPNEAVVPLSRGRAIPVEMQGGGGITVNFTVNAQDAQSFAGSRDQILTDLGATLERARRRNA